MRFGIKNNDAFRMTAINYQETRKKSFIISRKIEHDNEIWNKMVVFLLLSRNRDNGAKMTSKKRNQIHN